MGIPINLNKSFIYDTLGCDGEWLLVADPKDKAKDADKGWVVVGEDAFDYLKRSHNPYLTNSEILVPDAVGKPIPTPKCWHTDFSRRGDPDTFSLAGRVIPADATSDEVVRKVYDIAGKDPGKTKHILAAWSYRPKSVLLEEAREEFIAQFGLNPVFAREGGYTDVQLALTDDNIYCSVSGDLRHATDENIDIQDINVSYAATSELRLDGSQFLERIEFINHLKPQPEPESIHCLTQLKKNFWSYLTFPKV